MKPHAIVTCCDAKYGHFLIHHWLRSLKANVKLDAIDVVVIDYGLSEEQQRVLIAAGVVLYPAKKDGHPTNIRHRDIAALLQTSPYDQVLSVDGGDIIFQSDISPLFEKDKDSFRGVLEFRFTGAMHAFQMGIEDIRPEMRREMLHFMWDRPAVNGGVVLGPGHRFQEFYREFTRLCGTLSHFGTDQFILSYVLHKTGFVPLDPGFNFVLITTMAPVEVHHGIFLGADGSPIPVVHKAGMHPRIRLVRDFGYGPDRNRIRKVQRACFQVYHSLLRRWKHLWRPKLSASWIEPQSFGAAEPQPNELQKS
jgi:hypothetical protein